ncbi:hypothetical protein ACFYXL_33520 [Streptomyces tsukubensis]|uniref:hypothetical protein n=1 Tax=Streptomyces tsukubensis TaxID=83656 RepID=UPI0036CE478F
MTSRTGRVSARRLLWTLAPVELALLAAEAAGAPMPTAVAVFARVLLSAVAVTEVVAAVRGYVLARRGGEPPRAALRKVAYDRCPRVLVRLVVHEVRSLHSIWLWLRRRRDGVGAGDHAAGYNAPQNAMMWSWIGLSVVETVALAFLIPWPLVHLILLYVGVYGTVLMVGMQAAYVVRPHVAGADGSLRLRYGALFDLRIPAENILRVRAERRFPTTGSLLGTDGEGSLELIVGGQTTVAVDLVSPVAYTRPLGRTGTARTTVRFHADDPPALIAALGKAGAGR